MILKINNDHHTITDYYMFGLSFFESPKLGGLQIKNKYYLSVRKWLEMSIIDSVKFTHLSLPDTQTSISQTAISRINRKKFYAAIESEMHLPCYNDSSVHFFKNIFVNKN